MKNNYIERYIFAVTRYLPAKTQGDVEKELDALIEDMLAQRCDGTAPTEEDIRAVLKELGPPEELAARYSDDGKKALISGTYYLIYKYILKIVLPIVAAVVAFAGAITYFFEWSGAQGVFESFEKEIEGAVDGVVGGAVGGAIEGALYAFAMITIIFAILERKKVKLAGDDFISRLPNAVPEKEARIKPYEPVIEMILTVFFAIILIEFPYILGGWFGESAGWIPFFESSVLRGYWPFIIFWAALSIVNDAVKLAEGRYTKRLMIATVICNLLAVASAAIVFLNDKIINPAFAYAFGEAIPEFTEYPMFGAFNLVILAIIIFAALVEIITAIAKAWKYDR